MLRLTHAPAAALHARRSTPKGVSMRSLCSAEKRMHHTPDSRASQTPATPPSAPKTKRRKPGAVAAALAAAATPQAHTATSEAAPDRRAASPVTAQPYPTAPSTHRAAVRLLARLYPRVPALGRKQTSLPGDASAGHPRAS